MTGDSPLPTDQQLLAAFVRDRSAHAFAELVRRHIDMVHTAARRQVRNPHDAEDVTQAVFIVLARKARTLRDGALLAAWLLKVTHFVAANARKVARRRQHYQQEMRAMATESAVPPVDSEWNQLSPHVDAALARLSDGDRAAVVAHCLREQSINEVAAGLGLPEPTARKRIQRALERLRKMLSPHGRVSAAALPALLAAHGVAAAPPALAAAVTAGALAAMKGAAAVGTGTLLAQGAMRMLFWTPGKLAATGLAAATAVGVSMGAAHELYVANTPPPPATVAATVANTQQAVASYKGWVHVTYDDDRPPMDENMQTGANVWRTKTGLGLRITFQDSAAGEEWVFDPTTDVATAYSMEPSDSQGAQADSISDESARATWLAGAISSEVDPQTALVRQAIVRNRRTQQNTTLHLTYGAPDIKSIFDAGAPKNAKVVDKRAAPEVLAACRRLLARAEKPFPHGVLVELQHSGEDKPDEWSSAAYAQAGPTWTRREYLAMMGAAAEHKVLVPADWRTTGAEELFRRMGSVWPTSEQDADGKNLRDRAFDSDTGAVIKPKDDSLQLLMASIGPVDERRQWLFIHDLLQIGKDLQPEPSFGLGAGTDPATLITSADRPGQVALHHTSTGSVGNIPVTLVHDRWFDPTRTDCSVHFETRQYRTATPHDLVYLEIQDFTDFATLPAPDGRVYPTKIEASNFYQFGFGAPTAPPWGGLVQIMPLTSTRLLQFYPSKTLPEIRKPETRPALP